MHKYSICYLNQKNNDGFVFQNTTNFDTFHDWQKKLKLLLAIKYGIDNIELLAYKAPSKSITQMLVF